MYWLSMLKLAINVLLWQSLLLISVLIGFGTALGQSDSNFGRYYALVIGNENYKHLEDLKTPLSDAKEVGQVLEEKYAITENRRWISQTLP